MDDLKEEVQNELIGLFGKDIANDISPITIFDPECTERSNENESKTDT